MFVVLKVLIVASFIHCGMCTIDGLSYMDPLNFGQRQSLPRGYEPCNPLYWYPRNIPEYCYTTTIKPNNKHKIQPVPCPQPNPVARPLPIPIVPQFPLPYGVPLAPTNPMIPVAAMPHSYYSYPRREIGMLPGLPGLVSPDGGINIMPFSDAYSDVLEKHKQRMIGKRLQEVLDEYEGFPRRRRHKKRRSRY